MARKSHKRRRSPPNTRPNAVASVQRYSPRAVFRPAALPLSVLQSPILDRRTYHPLRKLRPMTMVRHLSRQVAKQNPTFNQLSQTKAILSFANPKKVALCVRRKIRKQVILALGKGGGGHRPPRRNETSNFSCR